MNLVELYKAGWKVAANYPFRLTMKSAPVEYSIGAFFVCEVGTIWQLFATINILRVFRKSSGKAMWKHP